MRSRLRFPSCWSGRRGGGSEANKGAPGVDGQALEEFEADLAGNLYKVWNVRNEC